MEVPLDKCPLCFSHSYISIDDEYINDPDSCIFDMGCSNQKCCLSLMISVQHYDQNDVEKLIKWWNAR